MVHNNGIMPYYPNYRYGNKPVVKKLLFPMAKKKALSNKSLTKKVKTLERSEGLFARGATTKLYDAVALVAGTEDLNYLTLDKTDAKYHYIDFAVKLLCSTAGGATVRILFCIDMFETDTDITSVIGTDSIEYPSQSIALTPSEYRLHKRHDSVPTALVYKDVFMALNNGEPKVFKYRMNLHGKRYQDFSAKQWQPFVSCLADEANVTISIGVNQAYTDLSP